MCHYNQHNFELELHCYHKAYFLITSQEAYSGTKYRSLQSETQDSVLPGLNQAEWVLVLTLLLSFSASQTSLVFGLKMSRSLFVTTLQCKTCAKVKKHARFLREHSDMTDVTHDCHAVQYVCANMSSARIHLAS